MNNENPNSGHGHVFPRPDGVRARCGGPGLCAECSQDLARSMKIGKAQATIVPIPESMLAHTNEKVKATFASVMDEWSAYKTAIHATGVGGKDLSTWLTEQLVEARNR